MHAILIALCHTQLILSQSFTRLTQHSSTLTHSVVALSSSRFIAAFHGKKELENSHLLLKRAVYLNFYIDGSPGQPIFGLKVSNQLQNNLTLEFRSGYAPLRYVSHILVIIPLV
jgi:hypothetical protein